MQGNLLSNILSALEQAKDHNYKALDHIIENGDEEVDITQFPKLSLGMLLPYYLDKRISIKEIIAIEIARSGAQKVIEHYSNFLFKDENLSIVPMFFASKEYIEVMLKNQDALNKLKKLKIKLQDQNVEINFFTAVACAVKEKELLNRLLTPEDIEQMYIENLQDKNSDSLYGSLQIAALSGNIEFIDVFLNESENTALGIKKIQPGFDLQDLGIDLMHERGPKSNPSSDISDTEDESAGEEESVISFNSLPSTPISGGIPDVDYTVKRVGSQESLDSGFDSGTSTPSNRSEIDLSETEEFNLSDHQEGFKKSLLEILEVAISQENGGVIQYLYKRFNETKVLKIKEIFITAVQNQTVKEALKKQETTRPGSIQVHDLMNKWFLDIGLERKFAAIKESICKLNQIDFRKNPEDLKETMEITYDLLDELKRDIIEALQTAPDNIKAQSIDKKETSGEVLKDENIQQGIKNSKEVKRILYDNQKSILDRIRELIIKIKI